MVQEFLKEWVNWYYGEGNYPLKLQDNLTYEQKIEAMKKTENIKKIIGPPITK